MSKTTTRTHNMNATKDMLVAVRDARYGTTVAKINDSGIPANSIYLGRLVEKGLVEVKRTVKSGKRGRPAHVYIVTDAGRAVAKAHAAAKRAQAAA